MKFCQTCGAELHDEAVVCVKCGCPVPGTKAEEEKKTDESVSVGLVILAVLIPLFGFIYWPVKAKQRAIRVEIPESRHIFSASSFAMPYSVTGLQGKFSCTFVIPGGRGP